MKKISLILIILISISCKSQSNLDLEQLIERDETNLKRLIASGKKKTKITELGILNIEFGQTEREINSILKKISDFEITNAGTKEFENYGINWKLNSELQVGAIIHNDFYKNKLYELEITFLTDKNIENGFPSLINYLRKNFGKEDLKSYSILFRTKQVEPFIYYWITSNRKIMAYKMDEYCYLKILDTSVDYDKLSNIFGNEN